MLGKLKAMISNLNRDKQGGIQIQYESINQGAKGQASIYNFTGSGVTVSVVGSVATVSMAGNIGAYTFKTAAYTAASGDYTIDCDGTFGVDLPTAVGITGRVYNIKNSGLGTITVNPAGSETIDGGLTAALSTQYENITIQSTGTNWIIL